MTAVTIGGPEYVDKVTEVITHAFANLPLTAYIFRQPHSAWPVDNVPLDIARPVFRENIAKKAAAGAELAEAGDWAAVAIWFPPGVEVPEGPDVAPRMADYREVFARMKREHLRGRKYWYLNDLGRHPQRHEPGVVRALIDPWLQRARAEGVPAWLEAITEHSRQVYEHLGFRTVGEGRFGVGKANARGEMEEGGEGMAVYGMIAEWK